MKEAEYYIDKLLEYYQVSTMSELAQSIGISQPSVSAWKKNNYVSAIKKKCRELGIYTDIFGDVNGEVYNLGPSSNGKVAGKDNVGIYNSFDKEFHFQEEYEKIEKLAKMGKGYENLKGLLEKLKEQLKEDI